MARYTTIESCAQHSKPEDTHFVRIPTQKCCCIFIWLKGRLCWIGSTACLLSPFGIAKSTGSFWHVTGLVLNPSTTLIKKERCTSPQKRRLCLLLACQHILIMIPGRSFFVFVMSLENARLLLASAVFYQDIICSGEMVRCRFGGGGIWRKKRRLGEKRCLLIQYPGIEKRSTTPSIYGALVMCPLGYY